LAETLKIFSFESPKEWLVCMCNACEVLCRNYLFHMDIANKHYRQEKLFYIITNLNYEKLTDDGRQVMTKAHVAFGKVSYKCEKLTDDGGQTTDAK
jgi:hypothetical protein